MKKAMGLFLSAVIGVVGCGSLIAIGYVVGKQDAKPAQAEHQPEEASPLLPLPEDTKKKSDEAKLIQGTVWYSERDKAWKFRHFVPSLNAPVELHKTEELAQCVARHRKLNEQSGRKFGDDCSFVAGLKVRYLPSEPGFGPAPCEIVEVEFVRTDFCFHCEHAIKVKRE